MKELKVTMNIVGEGHLADATRLHCGIYFDQVELEDADLVWFCVNMPLDPFSSMPLVGPVVERLRTVCWQVAPRTPILISSQVPVGFCANMEAEFPDHCFVVQPENIRTAHAVEDFKWQERMVVGMRAPWNPHAYELIHTVLMRFTRQVVPMSPESAEMVKHALNTFLAMEIAFANEIGSICGMVGANAMEVMNAVKSDRRVGDGPLLPGGPPRGSLPRDVAVLRHWSQTPLISAIAEQAGLL